ncbi:hypothetical protein F4803DRAFT_503457 [Xylaria telfairii]|nr:hypothetical protein F4803DRAFT_503457 [Xylaria telfairii]
MIIATIVVVAGAVAGGVAGGITFQKSGNPERRHADGRWHRQWHYHPQRPDAVKTRTRLTSPKFVDESPGVDGATGSTGGGLDDVLARR